MPESKSLQRVLASKVKPCTQQDLDDWMEPREELGKAELESAACAFNKFTTAEFKKGDRTQHTLRLILNTPELREKVKKALKVWSSRRWCLKTVKQ